MKPSELIQNLETTASQLTGRRVSVRIQEPINQQARAETYNAGGGMVVIDLAPEVFTDLRGFIRTFTHELAHAALHAHNVPVTNVHKPPASFKISPQLMAQALQHPRMDKRETEAEQLADTWRDAIKQRYTIAQNTPASDENLIQVLRVLYTFKKG
ncbi:MAG: hypothetical protein ABI904_00885 [Chloroflexota bacterium]